MDGDRDTFVKDIIEDDKNALYDKVKDNSFDFQNQLNMKDDSTDTKNEATYTAYRGFQSNIGYWQSQ